MTILFANNASTTISGSITAASTTVALAAGTGVSFPQPTGGNFYVATFYDQQTKTINEIIHVTAMAGDVATIIRAQEGTTAKVWNAGDIFANLITAGTLNAFVQAGTGPANTSIVYVGTDTSTDPTHIIAVTNPVPANYAVGMLFNIKVGGSWLAGVATNTGTMDLQLNGVPAVLAKLTDGADFHASLLYKNLEYTFVYNGVTFSSTLMDVPQSPPQTTFYVRTDSLSAVDSNGLESNTGFANTPQSAFKTLQGAANTIASRYISQNTITVMVADGTYTSGLSITSTYIAAWNFVGNSTNPQNCIINATSTADSSYVPGAYSGICFVNYAGCHLTINGFSCQSYYDNVRNNGLMFLSNMVISSPSSGNNSAVQNSIGVLNAFGNITSNATVPNEPLFGCTGSGVLNLGWNSIFASQQRTLHLNYVGQLLYVVTCVDGAQCSVYDNMMTLSGTAPANGFLVNTAGGIGFFSANTSALGAPGVVVQSTATSLGGTLSSG
jgi:hypothetical protein